MKRCSTAYGWARAAAAWASASEGERRRYAIERVVAGRSELRELWEEGGAGSPWHADVRTLLTRLGSTARIGARRPIFEKAEETEKQALLTFLRARGLEPTEAQLARIVASESAAEVRRWLARALLAPSVADVLDG